MSRLMRDGTAELVSRDREQDWRPCPVVMAIHISKLYIHTAVVTHICIYSSSEPCTNVHAPKKYIYWYLVYKPIQTAILYQYISSLCTYHGYS